MRHTLFVNLGLLAAGQQRTKVLSYKERFETMRRQTVKQGPRSEFELQKRTRCAVRKDNPVEIQIQRRVTFEKIQIHVLAELCAPQCHGFVHRGGKFKK
ncbi:hypothetical protein QWA68_013335 [Fusarium oxysporum]|nr:hypothetical protein QWA68_013335 [Fusarium oxysporum]